MVKISVKRLTKFAKVTGLIGKKESEPVLIETRFGIHTFGLKFPIDVLILNEENAVVFLKKNLSPNRIYVWNPKYKTVLELPDGFIKKNKIEKNSVLDISYF